MISWENSNFDANWENMNGSGKMSSPVAGKLPERRQLAGRAYLLANRLKERCSTGKRFADRLFYFLSDRFPLLGNVFSVQCSKPAERLLRVDGSAVPKVPVAHALSRYFLV